MAETRCLKRIVKAMENIKTNVTVITEDTCISKIKGYWTALRGEWQDFQVLEEKLKGNFDEANKELVEKIESSYYELKIKLIMLEKSHELTSENHENHPMEELVLNQTNFLQEISAINKRENEVRLPRVNIPPFTGRYSEFPSFKDLFEASIHKNENISDVHKLQYLKGLLKGEAYTLINHIAVTDVNYSEAWEKIKQRYDKPKHVVFNLLKQFMDQPALQHSSAKGLRAITDTSDEVVRGLRVLGSDAELRDPWLIYILVNKLDADSREAWAHNSAAVNYPTIKQFFEFLNNRSDTLEYLVSSPKVKVTAPKKVGAMVSQAAMGNNCILCSGNHYISKCEKYLDLSITKRKELAAGKKLCFNCLSSTHQATACRSKFTCRICKRKHHVTLHNEQRVEASENKQNQENNSDKASTSNASNVYFTVKSPNCTTRSYQAILPTAVILVEDKYGQMQKCRALLDSGSQSSIITESCTQRLGLFRDKTNINVTGLTAGNLISKAKTVIVMRSMYSRSMTAQVEALILNQLPTRVPNSNVCIGEEQALRDLDLADPQFDKPAAIDILVGADKFFEILEREQRRSKSLILQKTIFGWVVSGQPLTTSIENTASFTVQTRDDSSLEDELRKFWEIEDLPNTSALTPEEVECEQIFVNTHQRRADGRYVVNLPFKEQTGELGNSLFTSTRRFLSLERKLLSDSKLRVEYSNQMREYIDLGHMIETSDSISQRYDNARSYYLPHHAVTKETSSTTKVRIVFDGSSRTSSGVSLNEKLMVGPTIQPSLWTILLRFRTNKIAIVADIEKMYRQVVVAEEHRNYQRILWREKPDEKIRHYHLTRVTFGLACSSFLAIRALQQLAAESKDDEINNCLKNEFYVDDLLSGSRDLEQASMMKAKLTEVLASGGFVLRKWKSNSPHLTENLSEESSSDICSDKMPTTKTLGLKWYTKEDEFTFEVQDEKEGVVNKRKIVSESSRVFDPLGFLSPSIIILKVLFQKLWLLKLGWDDKLPRDCEDEYHKVRSQFKHFEEIRVPRFTNLEGEVQIHGFADASETAYCAVIYYRAVSETGEICSGLITSKTKVAPLKKISIPRLELCASHLLSKLMVAVKESLKREAEYFAWTDSKIVLAWLSTFPAQWKTFIANRTSQILEHFPRKHWGHVRSKENPADYGSRGVNPKELVKLKQWWNGPEWLIQEQKYWPASDETEATDEAHNNLERRGVNKATVTFHARGDPSPNDWVEELFERKFEIRKLFRIVAYVFRYIERKFKWKVKSPTENRTAQLTASEIKAAKMFCIKRVQSEAFRDEIQQIYKDKRVNNRSRLLALAPFVDEEGLLRVGGRLQNADCEYDAKHPIILPQKHIFTTRLIWGVHFTKFHSGPTLTSHIIRQNYWIINGQSEIRGILKGCIICKRHSARTTTQMMGNLPSTRVTPARPFENCGIDFAGPIYLASRKGRGNKQIIKGYISIFVCLSVKAIHIECVSDLTSEAFLAALKRFTARRGIPKHIHTDKGSNFVGAKRILEGACKLIKRINRDYIIAEFLSENGIEWHFIPPASPHFGGLWEAAVKSVKGHLLKATRNIHLTFEEISTLLCQIENLLNSRPLCTSSTDDDYQVLTPAHFLIGTFTGSIPEVHIESPENRLSRWQLVQSRIQTFWKRYYLEYINNMQQRHKWQHSSDNFKTGDVVLIKEDNTPASKWPYGRIIEIHPGKDELVRAVTLKTASSIIQRPAVKLCKLPVG